MMSKANEQLADEDTYPSLAEFLRSGGVLEVGDDPSLGSFVRIRKGNKTHSIQGLFRDLESVLKQMDSTARENYSDEPRQQQA